MVEGLGYVPPGTPNNQFISWMFDFENHFSCTDLLENHPTGGPWISLWRNLHGVFGRPISEYKRLWEIIAAHPFRCAEFGDGKFLIQNFSERCEVWDQNPGGGLG